MILIEQMGPRTNACFKAGMSPVSQKQTIDGPPDKVC